jgi:hypothetical protein
LPITTASCTYDAAWWSAIVIASPQRSLWMEPKMFSSSTFDPAWARFGVAAAS